ncbi:brachyurin-like [Uranotaenia lowii]|uniref:brachyurin-like n=1 Tax=Uranotaenia lowii TaxID=190385 RepID=UPI002479C092|nr:brachyurin-like [Uranotaenia lowii]
MVHRVLLAVVLICSLVTLNSSGASADIDWSLVRPMSEFPRIANRIQQLVQKTGNGKVDQVRLNPRIVGGQPTTPENIPYQAAILSNFPDGTGLCGGILVSLNYVLTAASCVDGASGGTVILGAQNIQNANEAGQVRISFTAANVFVHEDYVEFIFRNNIAVIRLGQTVQQTARIRPAFLPAANEARTFAGFAAQISGFGWTSDASSSFSDVLRYTTNVIWTNADCADGYWGGLVDSQKMCLSYLENRGPCVGDDGGPMTVLEAGQRMVVGMFSFGSVIGCESNWPTVFVRISFYLDWIASHTDAQIRSN